MAPCGWPVAPLDYVCSAWDTASTDEQQLAAALTTGLLWSATGRQYGVCSVTVRPCQPKRAFPAYETFPVLHGGDGRFLQPFIDVSGQVKNCGCGSRCCCDAACEAELDGPVAEVTEVLVDGVVVDASAYRVDVQYGAWLLVRTDGLCWPICQDFNTNGGFDTFFVTYGQGNPLPLALEAAWSILVCEFVKGVTGNGDCRLPARITSLTRQGVSVDFAPIDFTELGFQTGVNEVDQVVASLNPSRLVSPPTVISPDLHAATDRITVIAAGS